jgi:hypothetical protein
MPQLDHFRVLISAKTTLLSRSQLKEFRFSRSPVHSEWKLPQLKFASPVTFQEIFGRGGRRCAKFVRPTQVGRVGSQTRYLAVLRHGHLPLDGLFSRPQLNCFSLPGSKPFRIEGHTVRLRLTCNIPMNLWTRRPVPSLYAVPKPIGLALLPSAF